jgi:hypothetical protein
MKRLSVVTISLCVVLAVLCSAAIARGRAEVGEPDELQMLGLGVCESVPCFYGLIPGRTAWSEARKVFLERSSNKAQSSPRSIAIGYDTTLTAASNAYASSDGMKLGHVDIHVINNYGNHNLPFIAPFIARYGPPCRVVTQKDANGKAVITLAYALLSIHVSPINGRLSPTSKVIQVLLDYQESQESNVCDKRAIWPREWVVTSWRGFTNYEILIP